MGATKSKSAALRARLNHPVLDSDGHLLEFVPVLTEYLQKAGGNDAVKAFRTAFKTTYLSLDWYKLSPAAAPRSMGPAPALLCRSGQQHAGPGHRVCCPSCCTNGSTSWASITRSCIPPWGCMRRCSPSRDIRRLSCRALNDYYADLFSEYRDRMTPAALIPMHTPQEAIEELDYAVAKRGLKVVMLPNLRQASDRGRGQIPRNGALHLSAGHLRHRQRLRLRPGVGAMPGAWGGAPLFTAPARAGAAALRFPISCTTISAISRAAGEATAKSLFMGGVTLPLSQAEIPLSGRRRGLGALAAVRPGGALGEAQSATR